MSADHATRLREISAELADLIPPGEALIFSRKGYSFERIRRERPSPDAALLTALLAYVDVVPYLKPAVPESVPPPNVIDAGEVTRRLRVAENLAADALAAAQEEIPA